MNTTFVVPGVPDATGHYVHELPIQLDDAVSLAPLWHAKRGTFLLHVPYIGAFRVTDGARIEVAAAASVDQASIDAYLHGCVRAALLQQRGEIALHGVCLLPPERAEAVVICGASATGKSTLAAELCRRGWKLMADDLTRVECVDPAPQVWPSDTCVKLWRDACEMLDIDATDLPRIRRNVERYSVSVPSHDQPVGLRLVLELRYQGQGLEPLPSAADRMLLLNRHVFRRRQIAALGMQVEHGKAVMRVAVPSIAGLLHGSRTQPVQSLANRVEEALLWIPR